MTVSILSPVYNESQHVDEMIRSVVDQDFDDWELLFVDDGSTDDTADRIESYARADKRIRLISRDAKLGKVRAFNRAYDASTGDVIVLLAGDDRLASASLRVRHAAVVELPKDEPGVGFFKIRTFSTERKFDGMVVPRGEGVNRSGGSIAMNRSLASLLFPIDESLIAEDLWLAHASSHLARSTVEKPVVVLDYRIHEGNSNPRNKPFSVMSESMHLRHLAWQALLDCPRFDLDAEARAELAALCAAEELRYAEKTVSLMRADLPLIDRAAMAAMSSPWLYAIRSRFYRLFSGLRGK